MEVLNFNYDPVLMAYGTRIVGLPQGPLPVSAGCLRCSMVGHWKEQIDGPENLRTVICPCEMHYFRIGLELEARVAAVVPQLAAAIAPKVAAAINKQRRNERRVRNERSGDRNSPAYECRVGDFHHPARDAEDAALL